MPNRTPKIVGEIEPTGPSQTLIAKVLEDAAKRGATIDVSSLLPPKTRSKLLATFSSTVTTKDI
jgi:hypothetical protein